MIKALLLGFLLAQTEITVEETTTEQTPAYVKKYENAARKRWTKDIEKLKALDKVEKDPKDAILFLGSSSVRRWDTIGEDMAPWPTIRRGYGGAKFSDLAIFAHQLTEDHRPRATAIFVGNDISGKDEDKRPGEILRLVKYVVGQVRDASGGKPVFLIAITPTGSRFDVWGEIENVNNKMDAFANKTDGVYFIDTADAYLQGGKPNDSLFVDDRLHLNEQGYEIWSNIIKEKLSRELGEPQS